MILSEKEFNTFLEKLNDKLLIITGLVEENNIQQLNHFWNNLKLSDKKQVYIQMSKRVNYPINKNVKFIISNNIDSIDTFKEFAKMISYLDDTIQFKGIIKEKYQMSAGIWSFEEQEPIQKIKNLITKEIYYITLSELSVFIENF